MPRVIAYDGAVTNAGWYPDPGKQPGKFRYWDGAQWSVQLSDSPHAPPPGSGLGQQPITPRKLGQPPAWGTSDYRTGQTYAPQKKSGSKAGWIIALIAGVTVLILVTVFAIRGLGGLINGDNPNSNPTEEFCPKQSTEQETPASHPADGRVHGGKLSYPRLSKPWLPPSPDHRVPFGRDVAAHTVTTEPDYQPGRLWEASILVGELVSGDGFFSPQQGSEIVTKCVLGVFYGDAKVARNDKVNKAITVDGRDAWLLRTHLTFNIRGLKAKGEEVIIVVVATGKTDASLYYASIPDNAPPELLKTAESLVEQLKVGP